jgi:hypothetical protein
MEWRFLKLVVVFIIVRESYPVLRRRACFRLVPHETNPPISIEEEHGSLGDGRRRFLIMDSSAAAR